MNLPNALSLGRIFLVPLLVVVLLTKFEGKELTGAAIFGLASLTDWLDGYLARRRQQVTTLGQLLDPLADKLLIIAALAALLQNDVVPAWMVAVILGREFVVTVLRGIAHARGVVIAASPLGKFKMVSQVVAILLLILGQRHLQEFAVLGTIALWVAVIATVISGMDYYRRFNHVLQSSNDELRTGNMGNLNAEERLRLERGDGVKPGVAGPPREREREPSAAVSANARTAGAGGGAPAHGEGWGPASIQKKDVRSP